MSRKSKEGPGTEDNQTRIDVARPGPTTKEPSPETPGDDTQHDMRAEADTKRRELEGLRKEYHAFIAALAATGGAKQIDTGGGIGKWVFDDPKNETRMRDLHAKMKQLEQDLRGGAPEYRPTTPVIERSASDPYGVEFPAVHPDVPGNRLDQTRIEHPFTPSDDPALQRVIEAPKPEFADLDISPEKSALGRAWKKVTTALSFFRRRGK